MRIDHEYVNDLEDKISELEDELEVLKEAYEQAKDIINDMINLGDDANRKLMRLP